MKLLLLALRYEKVFSMIYEDNGRNVDYYSYI